MFVITFILVSWRFLLWAALLSDPVSCLFLPPVNEVFRGEELDGNAYATSHLSLCLKLLVIAPAAVPSATHGRFMVTLPVVAMVFQHLGILKGENNRKDSYTVDQVRMGSPGPTPLLPGNITLA